MTGITLPEAWERRENLTNSKRRRTTRYHRLHCLPGKIRRGSVQPLAGARQTTSSGSVDLSQRDLAVRDHYLRPAWAAYLGDRRC